MDKHPEYMNLLESMIDSGQIELMSGGYYEPILTVIPERDRLGQLEMMRKFLKGKFNMDPEGCWLTERIWDPHLPGVLVDAGLNYVVVDDSHFKSTGFNAEEMRGFFRTEENGKFINVFPIDMKLRYLIPFHDPQETIGYFRRIAEEESRSSKIVVLADDGEKFGLWPGTNNLCYSKKWLHRFCQKLEENMDWLEVSTFSKVLGEFRAEGIVYLPTASYNEMMEWALPLRAQISYKRAQDALESKGLGEESVELLRGGFWCNFMVKYEESNWMHKRMLLTSNLVEIYRNEVGRDSDFEDLRRHLYKAQCNCAYWHGLFGGLYLPHLRSAIYKHLISAENIIQNKLQTYSPVLAGQLKDIDGDGVEEAMIAGKNMRAYIKLRGGSLRELDIFEPPFNLTDTLTRRKELYHQNISKAEISKDDVDQAVSIHNISRVKGSNLDKSLVYDSYPRASCLDHFIGGSVGIESFSRSNFRELGDFVDNVYQIMDEGERSEQSMSLQREGSVIQREKAIKIKLSKKYSLMKDSSSLVVEYKVIAGSGRLKCLVGVETVFSFLAGEAPDRYYRFPGRDIEDVHLSSMGEELDVDSFSMVDEWLDVSLNFTLKPVARLWRFPLHTISNSETGLEKVYQGSVIMPIWSLDLDRGNEYSFNIAINVGSAK
jgi:alpha-amylase/alpha-mannosidase (GH57 family)